MTRWWISALLALNLALLAWNLAAHWGWDAERRRDALRPQMQVRPETLQLWSPASSASSASAAASGPVPSASLARP
jgi:hypothetical protein